MIYIFVFLVSIQIVCSSNESSQFLSLKINRNELKHIGKISFAPNGEKFYLMNYIGDWMIFDRNGNIIRKSTFNINDSKIVDSIVNGINLKNFETLFLTANKEIPPFFAKNPHMLSKYREFNPVNNNPAFIGWRDYINGNDTIGKIPFEQATETLKNLGYDGMFIDDHQILISESFGIFVVDKKNISSSKGEIRKSGFDGLRKINFKNNQDEINIFNPTLQYRFNNLLLTSNLYGGGCLNKECTTLLQNLTKIYIENSDSTSEKNDPYLGIIKIDGTVQELISARPKVYENQSYYFVDNARYTVSENNLYLAYPFIDTIYLYRDKHLKGRPLKNLPLNRDIQNTLIYSRTPQQFLTNIKLGGFIEIQHIFPSKNSGNVIVLIRIQISERYVMYAAQEYNTNGDLISSTESSIKEIDPTQGIYGYDPSSHSAVMGELTEEQGWVLSFLPMR